VTDKDRKILFEIRQLEAKWADIVKVCLSHIQMQRETMEALRREIGEMKEQIATLQQGSLFERRDSL
jgi:polyhydroxyalkanoate synthesis regulator phasin